MNVIEKILAAHATKDVVAPGDIVKVDLDYVMANDATACLAIDIFQGALTAKRVFNPEKMVLVMDHFTPSSSVSAAAVHRKMRKFAEELGVAHVYDGEGICHQLMMERHVRPGQLIIGADSHTCTYGALGALATGMGSTDIAVAWMEGKIWMRVPEAVRITVTGEWPAYVSAKDLILKIIGDLTAKGATYKAIVFEGPGVTALGMSERMTLCNMVIEAGAKFAYIQPDDTTVCYLKKTGRTQFPFLVDDTDAVYGQHLRYDVGALAPQVASPHSVDNVQEVTAVEGLTLDEVFIGACTNGRHEDLAVAAMILKGRRIPRHLRLLVTPASNEVYVRALQSGLLQILIESGAMIGTPGCSACFGGTGGIVAEGERLLTTANRNFQGRVGSPESEIYLASPAVAAASALTGVITDPRRMQQ